MPEKVQTPPAPTGPWAKDIAEAFTDPEVAAGVSAFLGQKVQPYVTRLEGERGDPKAQEFYSQFQDDQGEAFLKLAEQLFGEEAVEGIVNVLLDEGTTESATTEQVAPAAAQLTPEQQAAIDWANSQKGAAEEAAKVASYEAERTEWLKANGPEGINPQAFDVFVAQEGDWGKALAKYGEFAGSFTPAADPPADPPATVPSGAPTPATEKVYTNFDDAFDDTMAEIRAARPAPPTV